MDGNLLDSENADATLAKEWSLPELPPGVENNLVIANSDSLKCILIISQDQGCCILFNVHQFIVTSNKTIVQCSVC